MQICELFGLEIPASLTSAKDFVAGMECEIESVRSQHDLSGFRCTNDGSLRNSGVEFISPPLSYAALLEGFIRLQNNLELFDKTVAFSERTSTHVHINCASLETGHVTNLVRIYALFEEVFFSVVSKERRNNIHCVPLTETHLPALYHLNIAGMTKHWHKYTALNLKPLATIGTVEFRHLQGTGDALLVQDWLTILRNLWIECQLTPVDAVFLQDARSIYDLYLRIFGQCAVAMNVRNHLMSVIANNLLDVKLSFTKD